LLKNGSTESTPAVEKAEKKKGPKGKKEGDKVIGGRVGKGEGKVGGKGRANGKGGKKDKGVESVNGDEGLEEEEDVEDVIEEAY